MSSEVTLGCREPVSSGEAVELLDFALCRNSEDSTAAPSAFISTHKSQDYTFI